MQATPAFDLTDPELFAQGPPHDVYRWLRDEAPLYWHAPTAHTPDGEGFWCLTRHADVRDAARTPERFSSVNGGERRDGGTLIEDLPYGFAAGVLLNMQDDPRHGHLRRIATPSVAPARLREIRSTLAVFCDRVLDAAMELRDVDFLTDVAAELPLQALAALLGVDQDDRHVLIEWADAILDYEDHDPGDATQRTSAANAAMAAYCERVMDDKRRCPTTDLLSAIATSPLPPGAEPPGPMSEPEQTMFFHLLAAAGSETTRNTIVAGLDALIDDPDAWDALRRDPRKLPGAIEEMIRWASSTIYNRRTATETIELHGSTIEPGDKVVLWWQAANFDERVFNKPEVFDIHRDPNPHLAFGFGTHFCLGSNLARVELDLIFSGLLARGARVERTGPAMRTRSNKHAGFRHFPVRITRE